MMTFVMANSTSRQRILAFLNKHKGASAEEISLALHVTPSDIRYHLSILVSDGRVKVIGMRPEHDRGRPVTIYSPVENPTSDLLARLAEVLLAHLVEGVTSQEIDRFTAGMAMEILPTQAGEENLHITRRLAKTIEQLNRAGYESRWEAHAAAPRIIFERCPFNAVIANHPELCQMDAHILEQHLGGKIEQTAVLEKTARGTLFCQFLLKLAS